MNEHDQERLDTQPVPFQVHTIFARNPLEMLRSECPEDDYNPLLASKTFMPNNPESPILTETEEIEGERHSINKTEKRAKIMPSIEKMKKIMSLGPTELIMRSKNFDMLPKGFVDHYKNLVCLDFSENQFKSFPTEICLLKNLTELKLNNNQIPSIPSEISNLTGLRKLNLSSNQISEICPDSFVKLIKIQQLFLSENNLPEFYPEICRFLLDLRILHLQNNMRISYIPAEFYKLEQLAEFGFDWHLYLNPAVGAVMKNTTGKKCIEETRNCCKYYYNEGFDNQSDFKTVVIKFIPYLKWFAKDEENGYSNFIYSKERTPLHLASIWGHAGIVKEIIDSEISLNSHDDEGSTALSLALRCNKVEIAELLLSSPRIDVGIVCQKYGTPLHIAIIKGLYDIAEKIIKLRTVKPNARDSNGNTIFHYLLAKYSSCPQKSALILSELLENHICNVNAKNNTNIAPLHCAAKKNQIEAIKYVIAYNSGSNGIKNLNKNYFDFNTKGGKYEFTILHYVVIYMDIESSHFVLDNTDCDVLAEDIYGRTPRDLVKNTAVGKLLHKYELNHVKNMLYNNAKTAPEPHVLQLKSHKKPIKSRSMRPQLTISNSAANLQGNSSEIHTGNTPFSTLAPPNLYPYSDLTPKQFPEHLATFAFCSDKNIDSSKHSEESSQICIQKVKLFEPRNIMNSELNKINLQKPVHCKKLSKLDDANILETEGKTMNICMRPTIHATKESKPNDLLFQKCKFNIQKNLILSKEELILINNQFRQDYNNITESALKAYQITRILMRIFKKFNSDAENIFSLLADRIHGTNLIDFIYLVSQTKSCKTIQSLSFIQKTHLLVNLEILNANLCTDLEFPLHSTRSAPSKQKNSASHFKQKSTFQCDISPTNNITQLARSVQFIPIKKALNYFDETNS